MVFWKKPKKAFTSGYFPSINLCCIVNLIRHHSGVGRDEVLGMRWCFDREGRWRNLGERFSPVYCAAPTATGCTKKSRGRVKTAWATRLIPSRALFPGWRTEVSPGLCRQPTSFPSAC